MAEAEFQVVSRDDTDMDITITCGVTNAKKKVGPTSLHCGAAATASFGLLVSHSPILTTIPRQKHPANTHCVFPIHKRS